MRNSVNSITSFTIEEMQNFQDKLFAVHITSDIPRESKQIAGNTDLLKKLIQHKINYAPLSKPTLHWCLGRAIPKFYNNNYITQQERESSNEEQAKYAIITQLKNLFPQLININFKYTITLDDYCLTNKDYVLIPNDANPEPWKMANIIYYNPELMPLKQAVIDFVKNQNGIIIKEELEKISDTNINFLHKYVLEFNQENIYYVREKDPCVFNNIIQELGISFGTDEEIVSGYFLGYLEGIQEKITSFMLDLITSDKVEFGYTIEYIELLEYSAKCIQKRLSDMINNCPHFSVSVKERFNQQQKNFYTWLKIYELEKYLYTQHYKTLMGADKTLVNSLINNLNQPLEKLLIFIEKTCHLFKECVELNIEKYYLEEIYLIGISFFRKILLEDFIQISCFSNNPGHILLYVLAHIKNGAVFEANNLDADVMLKLLNTAFINLLKIANHQHNLYVQKILTTTLENVISINSYTDEPIIYGGKDVVAFLANKCEFFNQFLMLNSNILNTNYNINDFQEYDNLENQYSKKLLFLYNNKERWLPMVKPPSTVNLEKKNVGSIWLKPATIVNLEKNNISSIWLKPTSPINLEQNKVGSIWLKLPSTVNLEKIKYLI